MTYTLAYKETSTAYVTLEADNPRDAMNKIEIMKDCGEIDSKKEVIKSCISILDCKEGRVNA